MAVAITVNREVSLGGKVNKAWGTLAFSGSYATGGDTLNFEGKIHAARQLRFLKIEGESGFVYKWRRGTDLSDQKVKVFGQEPTNATAGVIALTEHTAAAYAAGITGDTVRFSAEFEQL